MEDSVVKTYMYLDGDIIYVSPEENDAIIYANENCYHMFYNCASLTSLDVSNFNTSNVTNMSYMFQSCSKLTTLDLSSVTESSVMMDIMTGKVNWDGVDIIINIDRTSPIELYLINGILIGYIQDLLVLIVMY